MTTTTTFVSATGHRYTENTDNHPALDHLGATARLRERIWDHTLGELKRIQGRRGRDACEAEAVGIAAGVAVNETLDAIGAFMVEQYGWGTDVTGCLPVVLRVPLARAYSKAHDTSIEDALEMMDAENAWWHEPSRAPEAPMPGMRDERPSGPVTGSDNEFAAGGWRP